MKNYNEIVSSNPIFLQDFSDADDVFSSFNYAPTTERILIAEYEPGDYSGSAAVFFEKDGEFYELYGSHCSCYGLENQWEPEKINLEAYEKLLGKSWGTTSGYIDAVKTILGI